MNENKMEREQSKPWNVKYLFSERNLGTFEIEKIEVELNSNTAKMSCFTSSM